MRTIVSLIAIATLAACLTRAHAADWPRFRGADGSGVSAETGLPATWSDTQNVAWKVDLPGPGTSSPIVVGNRVFVTCYSGYGVDPAHPGDQKNLVRHVVCVNLTDGKLLWDKTVPATLPEDPYEGQLIGHGYASNTPAADQDHVFAFFGKSGVVAFDNQGKQLWQTSVGTQSAMMGWGSAASLLLYKDLVIVNANAESQSIVALEKATGRQAWKADAKGYTGSWNTPVLVNKADGKQELIVFMPDEIWGLRPDDGALLWFCGARGAAIPGIVARDEIVYAIGGGPMGTGSEAIRIGGRGDVAASRVVWKKSFGSYVPSPIALGKNLYWADDKGFANCLNADTGEQIYHERIPKAGSIYASAVAADGKLYVVTRRNGTFVLPMGEQFKVLAQNRFASDTTDFNASPAISQGRLLLRSNRCLYCIAGK